MSNSEDDIYSDVDDTPLFITPNKPAAKSGKGDQWLTKLPIETKDIVKAPKSFQGKTKGLHATAAKPRKAGHISRRRNQRDNQDNSDPGSDTEEAPMKLSRTSQTTTDVGEARNSQTSTSALSPSSSIDENTSSNEHTLSARPQLHRLSSRRGIRPIARINTVRMRVTPRNSMANPASVTLPDDMADILLEQMLLASMQEAARSTSDIRQLALLIWSPKFCRQLVMQFTTSFSQAKDVLSKEYPPLQQLSNDLLRELQQEICEALADESYILKQCHNIAKTAQEQGKPLSDPLLKASNVIRVESSSEPSSMEMVSSTSSDDTLIAVKKERVALDDTLSSSSVDTEPSGNIKSMSHLADVKSTMNNANSNVVQLLREKHPAIEQPVTDLYTSDDNMSMSPPLSTYISNLSTTSSSSSSSMYDQAMLLSLSSVSSVDSTMTNGTSFSITVPPTTQTMIHTDSINNSLSNVITTTSTITSVTTGTTTVTRSYRSTTDDGDDREYSSGKYLAE
ncbi:hypothetical protein BDF22DRAFT_745679 [Syncephalis plumigaleata]|nr:hypothetical protein BDF22DRAFT_745679 [Syncephalis plumigaleata]